MNTNPATKSVDQNVQALSTVCHVVEVKAPFALVHATPTALAQIIGQLGLTVSPSKKGGDYYAVQVEAKAPRAPRTARAPLAVAPPPAPVAAPPAPPAAPSGETFRMEIKGETYVVRETATKRNMDSRRWEARKLGDEVSAPRVVTFQDNAGTQAQCSCEDWIYRHSKRPDPDCKHCKAFKIAFARRAASNVA
jgi:hypothetical protein